MTTAQYTRRILSIYRSATDEDREEGLAWYREANAFAASLDTDIRRAAGVIAVLSPLTSWPMNVRLATAHYNGIYGGCLTDSTNKAQRILNGEPVDNVVSGAKVTAFFNNILLDPNYVTIDRHAVDIALGCTNNDAIRGQWMRKGKRTILETAYRNAAKRAGVLPYEIQAITWVSWRKYYAQAFHG